MPRIKKSLKNRSKAHQKQVAAKRKVRSLRKAKKARKRVKKIRTTKRK